MTAPALTTPRSGARHLPEPRGRTTRLRKDGSACRLAVSALGLRRSRRDCRALDVGNPLAGVAEKPHVSSCYLCDFRLIVFKPGGFGPAVSCAMYFSLSSTPALDRKRDQNRRQDRLLQVRPLIRCSGKICGRLRLAAVPAV